MKIDFTRSSRKHRIGRARMRAAMADAGEPITVPAEADQEDDRLVYVGTDDRGVELEVIAVPVAEDRLLVIHAMPTHYRRRTSDEPSEAYE